MTRGKKRFHYPLLLYCRKSIAADSTMMVYDRGGHPAACMPLMARKGIFRPVFIVSFYILKAIYNGCNMV